ncbi:MAG: hypothetical protein KC419_18910 [Anaerolineales bacterium]|nr:hypothetical protein [Anaerolineales bacterium]
MHEHTGGEQIMRASKLVMACYAAQPEREVPHVGEIQRNRPMGQSKNICRGAT